MKTRACEMKMSPESLLFPSGEDGFAPGSSFPPPSAYHDDHEDLRHGSYPLHNGCIREGYGRYLWNWLLQIGPMCFNATLYLTR